MTEQTFDAEDIKALLARKTQDGPGTDKLDELPPGDFVSFTDPDVEKEDK